MHVSAVDLELDASYEPIGDVLYLSAPGDEKRAPTQATPEGHAVRLDEQGRITHLTAVNAKWLLDRDGDPLRDVLATERAVLLLLRERRFRQQGAQRLWHELSGPTRRVDAVRVSPGSSDRRYIPPSLGVLVSIR